MRNILTLGFQALPNGLILSLNLKDNPSKNQQKMVKFSYLIGCSPSQNQLLNTSLPTMSAFFPNFLFPLPHLPSPGQEEQCTEMGPSMETWQSTNNG